MWHRIVALNQFNQPNSRKIMSKLLAYLNHLDQNADARDTHEQDSQQAMTSFGLTAEEQQAVQSGDKEQVAKLVGVSSAQLPVIVISQF